jgi:phage tail protein X
MRKYITAQGDTWDIISYKMYGSEKQMSVLIEANPEHRETTIFSADVVIKLPEVSAPVPTSLPPWKR